MEARPEPIAFELPEANPIEVGELRAILSGLGDELSHPLISLRAGFDKLLSVSAQPMPEDQLGQVRLMVGLCDGLLELTRSYLDFAGMVHGATTITLETVTLGRFVDDLNQKFSDQAAALAIRWSCGLAGADAIVTTDPSVCSQVFGNLVSNALKHTPEGGEVTVTLGKEGPEGWCLSVSDSGPGIPDTEIENIFQPFYRLGRDQRGGGRGHGLGLSISRELTRLIGGWLTLGPGAEGGTVARFGMPNSQVL